MDDLTLQTPLPPEPEALLVKQAKTAHFWIFTITSVITVVLRSGIWAMTPWLHLAIDLLPIGQLVGYQLAALWQPPRAQWTDEQRLTYYARHLRSAGYTVERRQLEQ